MTVYSFILGTGAHCSCNIKIENTEMLCDLDRPARPPLPPLGPKIEDSAGLLSLFIGSGSHVFRKMKSEGDTSSSDFNTCDAIGNSTNSDSSSEHITYTIEDVETLYETIMNVIIKNEIRKIKYPTDFDVDVLMNEIMEEIYRMVDTRCDTNSLSSGNLGFSTESETSGSTISIQEVRDDFKEILASLDVGNSYLVSYSF